MDWMKYLMPASQPANPMQPSRGMLSDAYRMTGRATPEQVKKAIERLRKKGVPITKVNIAEEIATMAGEE